MPVVGLQCMHCGKEYPREWLFEGCSACRSADFTANLVVRYDLDRVKQSVTRQRLQQHRSQGLLRYIDLLPVDLGLPFLTLGAGGTPLVRCKHLAKDLDIVNLYAKDESRNPTGTFKDRYACVGGNVALQHGARCFIAGGGNMGAAAAAYAASYGLSAISIETTTEARAAILQTLAFGGKAVPLQQYEHRYPLMKKCVDQFSCHPLSSYTPSPTGDPYSQEGAKTIAYEICEDLGWRAPDKVIVPVGQGLALHGIWNGFVDFYNLGLIDSLPLMIGAESRAGGSFTKTNLKEPQQIKTVQPGATVARHAVAPKGSYKGLRSMVDSGGFPVAVDDGEVLDAVRTLAKREGLFPSTTSGTAVAALKKLRSEGRILKGDSTVCVITGAGFKDLDILQSSLPKIPSAVGPDWDEFQGALARHYGFKLGGVSRIERRTNG